jgi:membrane protein implicated in regulation of membrane protease activity
MIWWQWIVLGTFVLASEMFVDAEFYLVFLGISAVVVGEALPAGGRARVQLRGADWDAVNVGDEEIAANGRARVERASGLTLEVRAES